MPQVRKSRVYPFRIMIKVPLYLNCGLLNVAICGKMSFCVLKETYNCDFQSYI